MSAIGLKRRGLLSLSLLAAAAPVLCARARAAGLRLTVLCAADCPASHRWEMARLPAFLASPLRDHLSWRLVELPRLADVTERDAWPADLRTQYDRQRAQDFALATPWFFLEADERLLVADYGLAGWERRVLPAIRAAVETA